MNQSSLISQSQVHVDSESENLVEALDSSILVRRRTEPAFDDYIT